MTTENESGPCKEVIKVKLSFEALVTLMKTGSGVIIMNKENEPSVDIELYKSQRPKDLEDAIQKVKDSWDMKWILK